MNPCSLYALAAITIGKLNTMGKTKIQWADMVWNPVTGCSKVSAGCKNCYAKREWPRHSHPKGAYAGRKFEDVRCHPERLEIPLRWKKARMVFVNSMSDLFHESVPFEFIDRVLAVAALSQQHTFQILTKRSQRMREYLDRLQAMFVNIEKLLESDIAKATRAVSENAGHAWPQNAVLAWLQPETEEDGCVGFPPKNVWLGVSVENQETADARIPDLLATPAAVRFVSYEPALGAVDFGPYLEAIDFHALGVMDDPLAATLIAQSVRDGSGDAVRGLHWIICGGESGPGARPMHPDWARSVRDQCQAAGVSFFFKQWGAWLPLGPTGGAEGEYDDEAIAEATNHQHQCGFVEPNGKFNWKEVRHPRAWMVRRVGKKPAGRLLDGREWNEMPERRSQ